MSSIARSMLSGPQAPQDAAAQAPSGDMMGHNHIGWRDPLSVPAEPKTERHDSDDDDDDDDDAFVGLETETAADTDSGSRNQP